MPDTVQETTQFSELIKRVRDGDSQAMNALVQHNCDRLQRLARHMLRGFPSLRRWAETDDVLQNALIRMMRSLREVEPSSPREFFGLATLQIRRELIDLARHYFGPRGLGANVDSNAGYSNNDQRATDESNEPGALAQWQEMHETIGALPEEDREVVGLLFYEGLSQGEAADVLDISVRTVQRRWHRALAKLHETLQGNWPN